MSDAPKRNDGFDGVGDPELIGRARSGEEGAFAELWRRHWAAGVSMARAITSKQDPEDLVSTAFERIFGVIRSGGGPTGNFRPYLMVTIRNLAARAGRANREVPFEAVDDIVDESTTDNEESRSLDRNLVREAFTSLPSRWQEVLWYIEVERLSQKEAALHLGIKPSAVAVLLQRAKEGLRRAWINAHITDTAESPDHNWVIQRLGAHARDGLTIKDKLKLEHHLEDCARCSALAEEAEQVGSRLAVVLVPLLLGGGAAAYLSAPKAAQAAESGGRKNEASGHATTGRATRQAANASAAFTGWARSTKVKAGSVLAGAAVVVTTAVLFLPAAGPLAAPVSPAPSSASHENGQKGIPESSQPDSGETPADGAQAPESAVPFSARLDTGPANTFYPVVRGTAPDGMVIRVSTGGTVLSTVTAAEGEWSTDQLVSAPSGTLMVSQVGSDSPATALTFAIDAPLLTEHSVHGITTVTVTGVADAPFRLLLEDDAGRSSQLVAETLRVDGTWSRGFSESLIGVDRVLMVRYATGYRFGPPVSAAGAARR